MKLLGVFKHRDVRKRLAFTLFMLFVVRFGAAVVVPGVDTSKLLQGTTGTDMFTLMNMLGGGALQTFSILALGISPYITASIIIQLLSMDVIPPLTEWSKQGEQGKKKLDRATRYVTVSLAFLQAMFLTRAYETQYQIISNSTWVTYVYIAVILTAGTMFLMWVGDQITSKGIGNGVSLLIFAGIVASLPNQLISSFNGLKEAALSGGAPGEIVGEITTGIPASVFLKFGLILAFYLFIIVVVVFVEQAVRKIPIQYAANAGKGRAKDVTHLPIKVNSAGVIPVIFASSMLMVPVTIASFFPTNNISVWIRAHLPMDQILGFSIYLILIVAFSFFYANLQIDSEKISEDLDKSHSYIPGVRPGKDTKKYIHTVLNRLTVLGAIFLLFIAATPLVIQMSGILPKGVNLSLGGTGMIIVVGVALETTKQIVAKTKEKSYSALIRK